MTKSLLTAALAAAVLTGGVAAPAVTHAHAAQAPPDGALSLSGGAVGAGVGFVWGSGQFEYQGQAYPVKVTGLSVIDVGVAKINASGSVYNLKRIEDFNGTYTAFAAGATIAGGGGGAYLRNQNGVVIKLNSTSAGLRFNLSANGVQLKLEQ
jgi:hypothetical protein